MRLRGELSSSEGVYGREGEGLKRGYSVVLAFACYSLSSMVSCLMHICLKSREMQYKERRRGRAQEGRRGEGREASQEDIQRVSSLFV